MNKVAITGIGIISTLGNNNEAVSNALYHGKSGVYLDPERSTLGFSSPITGSIKGFSAKDLLNRKQLKTMPDFAVWAYAAVIEAISLSGLDPFDLKNERTGIILVAIQAVLQRLSRLNFSKSVERQHLLAAALSSDP